jgi:hypothetical protein
MTAAPETDRGRKAGPPPRTKGRGTGAPLGTLDDVIAAGAALARSLGKRGAATATGSRLLSNVRGAPPNRRGQLGHRVCLGSPRARPVAHAGQVSAKSPGSREADFRAAAMPRTTEEDR